MSQTLSSAELDQLCINTLRFLSVDAVQKADSGHPGLPLGAAAFSYVLWTRFLKHHPANPGWFDRDRFVLSAGHGSMLLYSLLHMSGYDLPLEQIKRFRQWESITPGHPERGLTPGVEVTTGPLGQGFANGVGMAVAEAHLAARYNRPGFPIVNHFTYGLVSDGDMMEGIASEAASLAGHLKLGKLIYLYDDNHVTLSAGTDMTMTADLAGCFDSCGWHTQSIGDGNDLEAVAAALSAAQAETRRPSLLLLRTHLGYGSPHKQDTFEAHGSPLGDAEVALTKENLGWPLTPPFHVPQAARAHFLRALEAGGQAESQWNERLAAYAAAFPDLARELAQRMRGELPGDWDADIVPFPADVKGMATRVASGRIMNAIAPRLPALMGGSGDLDPSTYTALKGQGDFQPAAAPLSEDRQGSDGGGWSPAGRNVHFGVREHCMAGMLNGMAAHGAILPFGATFLVFSDYMRPSIRLAALTGLHVVYVFTHDSIALGEDGSTHQPVEQLACLRAIPNLLVIRPCDANETAAAWRVAVGARGQPVALILTRQSVPTLDRSRLAGADQLRRGAYILIDSPAAPDVILMGSGSEVALLVQARERLAEDNIQARVVSMPSWELFEAQPREYRDSVLPGSVLLRLAVEAGISQGWHRYVGPSGDVLAVDRFGASAPGPVMMREYGFTVENICRRTIGLVRPAAYVR